MKLYLIEAQLTHDTELFGKMDPYCLFTYKKWQWQSACISSAGKHPKWCAIPDQFIEIDDPDHPIDLKVFDKDLLKSDLVGEAQFKISELKLRNGLVEIFYHGKSAGKVFMEIDH